MMTAGYFADIKDIMFIAKYGNTVELIDYHTYRIHGFFKSGHADVDVSSRVIKTRYNREYQIDKDQTMFEAIYEEAQYWRCHSATEYDHDDWDKLKERHDNINRV